MINLRNRFSKRKLGIRTMRHMWGLAPAVVLSTVLIASTLASSADAAAGRSWAEQDLKIIPNQTTGAVRFLRSKQGLESGVGKSVLRNMPKRAARIFLKRHMKLLRMPNADRELVFKRKIEDSMGMTHVRLKQIYGNVPVYGAEVMVHYVPGGKRVRVVNGTFIPYLALNTQPTLDSGTAIAIVREIQEQGVLWEEPVLRIYSGHIDPAVWGNHLAWLVRIYDEGEPSRNLYVVDAHTGQVLTTYDELTDARFRIVSDAQNTETLPGVLRRSEGDLPYGDPDVDEAYDYLGATYDYFFVEHNRDSYDDAGAALRATVHYGINYINALWDGLRMRFGDGFTVDDVTAHELSHAVTQFTANLIYLNQSGALNESYSDIFGEIVDLDYALGNDAGDQDYLMGEDLPIGPIRNMAHPPAFGDPDKVSDYFCTSIISDNGGVHINSGIPNKAAYLMAEGGSHNGRTVTGIGRVKMGRVQYRTLSVYLIASSGFVDYYNAMNQACDDLYGSSSFECQQVDEALLAVEMDTDPDCGGGLWGLAYPTLVDTPSDLKLMRQYRDEVLAQTIRGRIYTHLLYRNSEDALDVLNNNPELMAQAADLIRVNKYAISEVLAGSGGVIYNTDEIVAFLGAFARKSPLALRFCTILVRAEMIQHKKKGRLFLGFRLE